MNSLNLVGRLARDPLLRELADGRSVCDLRLVVNGPPNTAPLYLDVATFGKAATACARYLNKGREVAFSGQLVYREWQAEDGSRRSKHSAVGRVEFRGQSSSSPEASDADTAS